MDEKSGLVESENTDAKFLVVQLVKHLDYVSGVRHIGSFPTRDAADAFIQEKSDMQASCWKKRYDYIRGWVDALEIPEVNELEWEEYLNTFSYGFVSYYSSPKDHFFCNS